jgi:hypothetical protein
LAFTSNDNRKAERLVREAFEGLARTLGEEHPDTLIAMNLLSTILRTEVRVDEAATLAERAELTARRALGRDHPITAMSVGTAAHARERKAFKGAFDKEDRAEAAREFAAVLKAADRPHGRADVEKQLFYWDLIQVIGRGSTPRNRPTGWRGFVARVQSALGIRSK